MAENKSWLGRFLSKHFGSKGADEDQKVTAEQSFYVDLQAMEMGVNSLKSHLKGDRFHVSDVNPIMDNGTISLYDKVNIVAGTANALVRGMRDMEATISSQSAQILQDKVGQVISALKGIQADLPKYCEVAHASVLTQKTAGVQFDSNIKDDINIFKVYAQSEIRHAIDDLGKQSSRLQYSGNDLDKPMGGNGVSAQL